MDRGAWWVVVHGVSKSQTQLSMHAYLILLSFMWLNWGINLNHIYIKYNYIWFSWERVVSIGTREPSPAHSVGTQHSQLQCLWTIEGIASPGFPGGKMVKNLPCQCSRFKRHGFNPWMRWTSWNRKWQPVSVFLPEKSHGQRSLVGYCSWGHKESDMTEWLSAHIDSFPSRRTDHIPSAVPRGL